MDSRGRLSLQNIQSPADPTREALVPLDVCKANSTRSASGVVPLTREGLNLFMLWTTHLPLARSPRRLQSKLDTERKRSCSLDKGRLFITSTPQYEYIISLWVAQNYIYFLFFLSQTNYKPSLVREGGPRQRWMSSPQHKQI